MSFASKQGCYGQSLQTKGWLVYDHVDVDTVPGMTQDEVVAVLLLRATDPETIIEGVGEHVAFGTEGFVRLYQKPILTLSEDYHGNENS